MTAPRVLGDGFYGRSIWAALRLTMRRWLPRKRPPAYPRAPRRPGSQGVPGLRSTAAGDLSCTACWLCVAACPAQCIGIRSVPADAGAGRRLTEFIVALDRCLFCGNCVDACPAAAMGRSAHSGGVSAAREALSLGMAQLRVPRDAAPR